jgi:hypothetical protein
VAQIYQEAMRQVNDIIEDKKAGLIQSPITTVNIRGTITAGASPDVNISSKTLKRTQ